MNDSILEKLAKIKRHADSAKAIGSDAEAEAFASLLQRMLIEHKLEMTDLEFEEMERTEEVEKHYIDYSQYPDIKMRKTRVEWIERLAIIVARAHFCRTLVHDRSSRVTLVGRKSDAAVAEYMIITLQRLLERMSDKKAYYYRLECNRSKVPVVPGYRETYLTSFIVRLSERYEEERRRSESSGSTALIRLSGSLQKVDDWFRKARAQGEVTRSNAKSLKPRTNSNHAAYETGRRDANNVNLRSNAVGSGSTASLLTR